MEKRAIPYNTYVTIYFRYVESDEPTWRGYLYIVALVVVTIVNTIINAQALFMQYGIGLRIKTSLISAIYRKSLKLSSAGRKEMTGKDLLKYFFLILFKIFSFFCFSGRDDQSDVPGRSEVHGLDALPEHGLDQSTGHHALHV